MENIIFNAVLLLISIGGFLLGKFVFPNVPKSVADKLRQLAAWADKFVVWAREFMKTSSGHEKMEMVVEQLEAIAKEAGLNVTKDQLRAIAQAAYENMMKGAAGLSITPARTSAATPSSTDAARGPAFLILAAAFSSRTSKYFTLPELTTPAQ